MSKTSDYSFDELSTCTSPYPPYPHPYDYYPPYYYPSKKDEYCDCDIRCPCCGKIKRPYEITWGTDSSSQT